MQTTTQKLSVKEKLGYSLGDAAANFIFQTMMMFQLIFYTDTFGISAIAAGTLMMVARILDAIFDPMMGAIADRTNTKWGKFRPWVLWTALPFAGLAFLVFMTPDFGSTGKLVYAYFTYILFMMIYSANNLPYSALSGVMTGDMVERTSISSYRFVAMTVAAMIIQGLALPMVSFFGHGNSAIGYQYTIGILSAIGVIFFFIAFASTKERIQPPPKQKTPLKQDFKDLSKNKPWIVIFLVTIFIFITISMRNTALTYYFKYFLDKASMLNFLHSIGLSGNIATSDPSVTTFSIFNVIGQVANLVGILFSKALAKRFGKRNVYMVGLSFTALFNLGFYIIPSDAIAPAILINILWGFSYGPTIPLLWAMVADVADYSEWKNNRRATGIVFSAMAFGLKAGFGFGASICGWILTSYGYIPNAAQTADGLLGIRITTGIYPALFFLLGIVALFFYQINKKTEFQIQDELAERRKNFTYN